MSNRIIKESITTSDSINKLSWEAECFFYRLIVNCDDYGRMDGRLMVLLARCFPLRIGRIKEADVKKWLDELVRGNFIQLYRNGHEYLQIIKWDDHQQVRSQRSKYPAPTDDGIVLISDDINGNQEKSDAPVIQSNPNPNPNPNPNLVISSFDMFWGEYPKKSAKQDAKKAWSKIKPTPDMLETIMYGLKLAKGSEQWAEKNGRFIPNPATWLNGGRWEDEYTPYQPSKKTDRGSFATNKLKDMMTDALAREAGNNAGQ